MKRVVDGKSYNTDTAERIAVQEGEFEKGNREWRYETVLYRTPKGAWFTVESEWPEEADEDKDETRSAFEVLANLDAALAWLKNAREYELLNGEYFPAIEEA